MCKFFSLISAGNGTPLYFDHALRKKCLEGKIKYEPDGHSSIAEYFGFKGLREDNVNKYEYNPLTKKFEVDQLNTTDDSEKIERFCRKLDFKEIVPELNIHPIVHPFRDLNTIKVSNKDKQLLKQWDSVRGSVWDYTSSFFDLQQWKYTKHKKGKNPFQPCIDLWNKGLVPSFDGNIWRLHGGKDAKVLFKISKIDLKKL